MKLTTLLLIVILLHGLQLQAQDSIIYNLPEMVNKELLQGIKKTEKLYKKKIDKKKLVVSLSFSQNNYCILIKELKDETVYRRIANKSNRFVKLKPNLCIPVLFSFDTSLSSDFSEMTQIPYLNGYTIFFTMSGEIISTGFTQ